MVQGLDLGNSLLANFNNEDVEVLQLNGQTIWEKAVFFNYTGIDSSGNFEGMSAYDGTAVAYAIGKPTITITETTADDGTVSQTETISYTEANGLREEYFTEKYGSKFIKSWNSSDTAPLQCVENVLVLPDTYKNIPVTKILDKAFMARAVSNSVETRYQPYYYTNIVFGNNITTLGDMCFAGTGDKIELIDLPTSITSISQKSFGDTRDYNSSIRLNSNICSQGTMGLTGASGVANYIPKLIYGRDVTTVYAPASASGSVLVFEHQVGDSLTINYGTIMIKNALTITIYAENENALYFNWSSNNITPTYYHLDGTLWEMTTINITSSEDFGDPNSITWSVSGDAEYYEVSYGTSVVTYSSSTFSFNPLKVFNDSYFCINQYSYNNVKVIGYSTGKLRTVVDKTVKISTPDTSDDSYSMSAYGVRIDVNESTNIVTITPATSLMSLVESYQVSFASGDIVSSSATININNYATQLGLELGVSYDITGYIKLKNMGWVYSTAVGYSESSITY